MQDFHLGRAFLRRRDVLTAIRHLEKALGSVHRQSDAVTYAQILVELGNAYRFASELEQATEALEAAIVSARQLGLWHDEACAREILGQTLIDANHPDSAAKEFQSARDLYAMLGDSRAIRVEERIMQLPDLEA